MEMVVVVILMGIIYSLMLTYLKPKRKNISLLVNSPFRALLLPYWNHSHIILLCEHKCETCEVLDSNGSVLAKNISFPLKNYRKSKIYSFDDLGRIQIRDFLQPAPSQGDEKVCFRYDMYPNKSSSELFMEAKNGSVIYLPPYFNNIQKFASIDKAKNYFEDMKMDISR